MKVFISVDIEGVAGVNLPIQGRQGNPEYETARRLMTEEASAAVRGAFEGGASEVVVADSHSTMQNILPEDLDKRARLISGAPRAQSMIEGLDDSFAAAVFVGFHAMAGGRGVMSHTYNGGVFANIKVNGCSVGETDLFAGCAADFGVALIAVTGDDMLAAEVANSLPSVEAVIVKHCKGAWASDSLSPFVARGLIEKSVARLLRSKPIKQVTKDRSSRLSVEVQLTKQFYADACTLLPMIERVSAQSISFQADNYSEAVRTIQALSYLSSGVQR